MAGQIHITTQEGKFYPVVYLSTHRTECLIAVNWLFARLLDSKVTLETLIPKVRQTDH